MLDRCLDYFHRECERLSLAIAAAQSEPVSDPVHVERLHRLMHITKDQIARWSAELVEDCPSRLVA